MVTVNNIINDILEIINRNGINFKAINNENKIRTTRRLS